MRWRRWILRGLLGVLALAVLLVVAALLALAHLDSAPMKGIIVRQAARRGVALDFEQAAVTLGGVHVKNVTVRSPADDADLAPNLVAIGRIDGDWSPFHKRIDDLTIADVTVTVVVDDQGQTSLDRFLAGLPPSAPEARRPLSRLLEGLVPDGAAANVKLSGVTLALVPRGKAAPVRLVGVAAEAVLAAGRLDVKLGPTELGLTVGGRSASARLAGTVAVAPPKVGLVLEMDLVKQDLAPALPPLQKLVSLAAALELVPGQRTHVVVEHLQVADGAFALAASADLFDTPAAGLRPAIASAQLTADLVALARAVPAAYGPITVEAPRPIRLEAHDLTLAPLGGTLALDGRIDRLRVRDLEVEGLDLAASARPAGAGTAVHATLGLGLARLAMPGTSAKGVRAELQADSKTGRFPVVLGGTVTAAAVETPSASATGVKLALAGTVRDARTLDLTLGGDVARLAGASTASTASPASPATIDDTHVELKVTELVLADVPLESTGTLALSAHAARASQGTTRAQNATLTASAQLGGKKPSSATASVDVERLEATGLRPGPAHVELSAQRIQIDAADPMKSRAEARFLARRAGAELKGTISGSADAPVWDVTGQADALGPVQGLKLRSRGAVSDRAKDRIEDRIEADTTIELGRTVTGTASLRAATLHVVSTGTRQRQQATVDAALDGVTVRGQAAGSPRLHIDATGDLGQRRVELSVAGKSPDARLHLSAAMPDAKTLRWEAQGRVAGLGAYAALLPVGPDWDRLAVELRGSGSVAGVVTLEKGVPVLAPDPLASARGKQSLTIGVSDIHVMLPDSRSADIDAITLIAELGLGPTRTAKIDLNVPNLSAAASGVHIGAEGLAAHLDASVDARGAGSAALRVRARSLRQSAFASYPVRDADLSVAVTGDPRAVLSMTGSLANPGAGTTVQLEGALDRRTAAGGDAVPGRRSFWLAGSVDQLLDALTGAPDLLRARGKVSVPFRVESGDLALFVASARVELDDVALALPAREISVSGVTGHVPIVEEILLGPEGAKLVGRGERGLYGQLRFADHQPFLGTADYLAITEVAVADKKLGPLAGNARVDRDVVALDQLELEAAGGKITGQFLIQLAGLDTSLAFRGKVTGLRPTRGDDRLDANAALTLTPYRMGLEGRVEIVQIGKQHLRDLLDLYDPYHADVASNRVRMALSIGYPEQVRLGFLHGFASLGVSLGGLAGAVRLDDIQGVPIGPALAKYLAPVLEKMR